MTLGTFISVLNSTIVTVPLRDIALDLNVSIAVASLLSTANSLSFGALMPLGGWAGNRFGRRTVFCCGMAMLTAMGILGSFAPNVTLLIATRVVQGASSAALTPLVIAILAELYPPLERPRALSQWAAANALGQAIGPPLGGVLAGLVGWRFTLLLPALFGLFGTAFALRYVPADAPRRVTLDRQGAGSLTVGALLLLGAIAWMPQYGPLAPAIDLALAGAAIGIGTFVRVIHRVPEPFVAPAVLHESTYVRSAIGVWAGTFSLGAASLAVPLYLTRGLGLSTVTAGFVTFALPLAMVLTASPGATAIRRVGSVTGMRLGLVTLLVTGAALAALTARLAPPPVLVPLIFVVGIALSFVHTACAVGSTTSPASRYGAGVGLFNLIRVVGTTMGAAWVALVLKDANAFETVFLGSAIMAALGVVGTFAAGRQQAVEVEYHAT